MYKKMEGDNLKKMKGQNPLYQYEMNLKQGIPNLLLTNFFLNPKRID